MSHQLLIFIVTLVLALCWIDPSNVSQNSSSNQRCSLIIEENRLPTEEGLHLLLEKSDDSDLELAKYSRKKRQVSPQSYQDYLDSLGKADYDVRIEEGWQNILYPFGAWVMDAQLMGQAGRETQTNLGFDCPFFGFRFNYTFVYPMGMISFEPPPFTTPPWTFPNPTWPKQRDHAFIAPFYADAMYQWIGNTKISNTFYRSVHRPRLSPFDNIAACAD